MKKAGQRANQVCPVSPLRAEFPVATHAFAEWTARAATSPSSGAPSRTTFLALRTQERALLHAI